MIGKMRKWPKGNNLYLSIEYEFIVFLSALILYKQKKIHINLRSFITKYNLSHTLTKLTLHLSFIIITKC
jgi:hypothetical protein